MTMIKNALRIGAFEVIKYFYISILVYFISVVTNNYFTIKKYLPMSWKRVEDYTEYERLKCALQNKLYHERYENINKIDNFYTFISPKCGVEIKFIPIDPSKEFNKNIEKNDNIPKIYNQSEYCKQDYMAIKIMKLLAGPGLFAVIFTLPNEIQDVDVQIVINGKIFKIYSFLSTMHGELLLYKGEKYQHGIGKHDIGIVRDIAKLVNTNIVIPENELKSKIPIYCL